MGIDGTRSGCSVTMFHVGSRIGLPYTTCVLDRVFTVTSAKDHTDFKTTVDCDECLWHRSGVAAAIHIFYTRNTTILDEYLCVLAIDREVVRQVTATID